MLWYLPLKAVKWRKFSTAIIWRTKKREYMGSRLIYRTDIISHILFFSIADFEEIMRYEDLCPGGAKSPPPDMHRGLRSSSKVKWESLYTSLRALSCNLLILLLRVLLWNIQMRGQYPNWDSMKVFMRVRNLSLFIKLVILANACSFWLAFLQIMETWSLKFNLLSMVTPSNLTDFSHSMISSAALIKTHSSRLDTSRWHLSVLSLR